MNLKHKLLIRLYEIAPGADEVVFDDPTEGKGRLLGASVMSGGNVVRAVWFAPYDEPEPQPEPEQEPELEPAA